MKKFLFLILFLNGILLFGASVNKHELMEKSQWKNAAGAVFENQSIRMTGKVVLESAEMFKVNPRQIWLLTASFRAKDRGMCRLGFLPLDAEKNPFKNDNGEILYLWCAQSSDLNNRWKEVSGGIAGFSGNENVTVQWNPGAVSAFIVLSCEETLEITDFALNVLEE
jgi:hypothetical protein